MFETTGIWERSRKGIAVTTPDPKPLSWALVVATYQRAHILPRCLRLAEQRARVAEPEK